MVDDVVIVSMARTPMGSFGGKLAKLTAPELGERVIRAGLERGNVKPEMVDEVVFGCVVQAGVKQAPARQAALAAGIPVSCPCTTINKMCASGMKAVIMGTQMIKSDQDCNIVVAGGMESMSNAPFYSRNTRFGNKFGDVVLEDGLAVDGLRCAYSDEPMGSSAVRCAIEQNISRQEQDEYTAGSYDRARKATEAGKFKNEIIPVKITSRKKKVEIIDQDEEPMLRNVDYQSLSKLPSAFKKPVSISQKQLSKEQEAFSKSVTAGNASVISDGASCVILARRSFAEKNKLPILAQIVSFADSATEPELFPLAPVYAMEKAMSKIKLQSSQEVDAFEVNEAFSIVPLVAMKHFDIPRDKMNMLGGACSMGHPIGSSGSRILCTLLSALSSLDDPNTKTKKAKLGCAAICNGGGGASCVLIKTEESSSLPSSKL